MNQENESDQKETENFCRNIHALRLARNLTKQEMASLLGIGTVSLSKIEAGILPKRLSYAILLRLHGYFSILPSEIFSDVFAP